MPLLTTTAKRQRLELILRAARKARAANNGCAHCVTIGKLRTATGLSAGAIYGHFASKEEIVAALDDPSIVEQKIVEHEQKITEHKARPDIRNFYPADECGCSLDELHTVDLYFE